MGFKSFLPRNHRFLGRKPKVSRQETFALKPQMAKRHMLYGWSDIVMARNWSVRYPSSVVPSGLFTALPAAGTPQGTPLPSRGEVLALQASFGRARGGVCNVCNILSAKKGQRRRGCEEEAAKKRQRRRGSEEGTAKKRTAKKRQRKSYRPHPCPSP